MAEEHNKKYEREAVMGQQTIKPKERVYGAF
jgi:hypothetical protein